MANVKKEDLINQAEELGIELSGEETAAQLKELISDASLENELPEEDEAEGPGDPEDNERLTPEVEEPKAEEHIKPGEDYLQQYQYRKNAKFGSTGSNPPPGSKTARMKEFLLAQPRLRILIPRPKDADPKILQTVTLNGYRLDLPKNKYIEVPKAVADVIMESFEQTEAAILRGQIRGDEKKEAALN